MRVARLLSIVFEVDARPGITAGQLAGELGVSRRTVYRDVAALQQAGVPIYGTTGRTGGLRLVEGYRSRTATLHADEATALLAGVVPGVAEQLGFAVDIDRARRKVRAQSGGEPANDMILIDPVGWYRTADDVPHLATLAEAIRTCTVLTIRYTRWAPPTDVTRRIKPLGLVLKAGNWYVMARSGGHLRTYRVNQIRSVRTTMTSFEPDAGFDLAAAWAAFVVSFSDRLRVVDAHVRLSRTARDRIRGDGNHVLCDAVDHAVAPAAEHHADVDAVLPYESVEHAASDLLRFGPEVHVLAPTNLRRHIKRIATTVAANY